jgi:hypothetical protein
MMNQRAGNGLALAGSNLVGHTIPSNSAAKSRRQEAPYSDFPHRSYLALEVEEAAEKAICVESAATVRGCR